MKDNIMMIQGTEILVKEWRGKRVVTFKDVDAVHRRPEGTARKRFNDNRKRFISGVDFFKVKCCEVRPFFGQTLPNGFNPDADITLITESGYLMLVKSFTDDLAWKVQRELVDTYFRFREGAHEVAETETVTVSMVETEKLIRCGEIMAGCLEGNRPYVLNILRHIIPDIDRMEQEKAEVKINGDVVKVKVSENKTVMVVSRAYGKPFNHDKFDSYLSENRIKLEWLAEKLGCHRNTISTWRHGVNPIEGYRIKMCEVLGLPIGYFDKKVRKRR